MIYSYVQNIYRYDAHVEKTIPFKILTYILWDIKRNHFTISSVIMQVILWHAECLKDPYEIGHRILVQFA